MVGRSCWNPDCSNPFRMVSERLVLREFLRSRYGKSETVMQVEPILDHEQELKGFMVFTQAVTPANGL